MVSLRKLFLIPAALVLVSSVASAVPAVVGCTVTPPTIKVLKSEGRAEKLDPLAFSCVVSTAGTADAPFTISIFTTGAATFSSNPTGGLPAGTVPSITGAAVTTAPTSLVVSPNVITFNNVVLKTGTAATVVFSIDGLYVDASMIPQGGSMGVSLLAASLDATLATSNILVLAPAAPAPVVTLPNIAIALKSLTVTDTASATPTPTLVKLKACTTDAAFDLTGVASPNGTAFDSITFSPILNTSLLLDNRVTFTVTNLPAGVQLYVPIVTGLAPGPVATLVAGYDANLANGYLASVTAGTGVKYVLLPASGTAVYQITTAAVTPTSALIVNVLATATGPVLAATPVSVTAGYAPVGTMPIPRYVAGSVISSNFITVSPCASTLFFPYVVAGGGYDTGIAISSSGLFGDASAAASGQCVISFMGKGAPMTTKTLDVTVGQTNAFDIVGSMPTANFYGYAVAKCNFLDASGYAYVANSTGGTASYLPLYMAK